MPPELYPASLGMMHVSCSLVSCLSSGHLQWVPPDAQSAKRPGVLLGGWGCGYWPLIFSASPLGSH